jgi:hypothetical protein
LRNGGAGTGSGNRSHRFRLMADHFRSQNESAPQTPLQRAADYGSANECGLSAHLSILGNVRGILPAFRSDDGKTLSYAAARRQRLLPLPGAIL